MRSLIGWKSISRFMMAALVPASIAVGAEDGWLSSMFRSDGDIQLVSVKHECPDCYDACDPCRPGASSPGAMSGPATTEPGEDPLPDDMTDSDIVDQSFAPGPGIAPTAVSFVDPHGYLEIARIASRVRVRYDDMTGANEPTRAEMWYPTIGNFGGPGPFWPENGAADPAGSEGDVDIRELTTYVEAAWGPRFSVFGEFPIRWVSDVQFGDQEDPVFTDGTQAGAGDVRGGIRYGIVAAPDEWLTLQVRAWAPTGEARRALGVGHSSIDVSLLYEVRTSQRTTWWAELNDWQTIDAGETNDDGGFGVPIVDLDANVLRYGFGVGYDFWQSSGYRPQTLTGVLEVVGWTVLDGVITPASFDGNGPITIEDADGDTIVNGKYGLRYSWFCGCHKESFYVGYGHNWTDDRWYSDILRLEMTHYF